MSILDRTATALQEFDLQIPSGRIHAQRIGGDDAPLVLCLPGLSANMKSFDFLLERLGGDGRRLVAVDLRGRGKSEVTAPGTYGWVNHARDVFALADALGAERFSLIGSSMGGAVALACAQADASRIERVALIDICGRPDESVLAPIGASVNRLGAVYPSAEAFIALVRQIGTVEPWSTYWERYFHYDLVAVEGGVAARSDRQAVMEDGAFGAGAFAFGEDSAVHGLWRHLTMPVLLLRATRELLPGFGHVVPEAERDRFVAAVPDVRVVEVDANHYGINTHEASAAAIAEFLGA
jgi:pimeloyl-ACP methyl ester carboxylesterase